jgi:hypothetical protein
MGFLTNKIEYYELFKANNRSCLHNGGRACYKRTESGNTSLYRFFEKSKKTSGRLCFRTF